MKPLLAAALLACACGDSGVVEVTIPGAPAYVVYRDSRGVWLTPERDGEIWRLSVDDDYELWSVCTGPDGSFFTQGLRATLDDGAEQALSRYPGIEGCGPAAPPAPLRLTGTMFQPGSIDSCVTGQWSLGEPVWSFAIDGARGRCDLIASDYDHTQTLAATFVYRLELELDEERDLGLIDVQHGEQLPAISVPITGTAADTTPFATVRLQSGGTTAEIAGLPGDSDMLTVPIAGEDVGYEYVAATTRGEVVNQYAFVDVTPRLKAITMIAPAPAEWSESTQSITWRAVDDRRTSVELHVDGESCDACPIRSKRAVATQRWLAAHRDHELAFEDDLPGYDPAWQIDTSRPYTAEFWLVAAEAGATYSASYRLHPSETRARSAR